MVPLSSCGVVVGFGTEENTVLEGGASPLPELVLVGSNDTELASVGRGTDVSVIESTGGGNDPELAGGRLVTVESGGTVLEETPVLEVNESVSLVLVDIVGGGRALELPLNGVTSQVFSSLTIS